MKKNYISPVSSMLELTGNSICAASSFAGVSLETVHDGGVLEVE